MSNLRAQFAAPRKLAGLEGTPASVVRLGATPLLPVLVARGLTGRQMVLSRPLTILRRSATWCLVAGTGPSWTG